VLLLVSGATEVMRRYRNAASIGWLLTPRNGNSMAAIKAADCFWAADNDCFQRLDRGAYLKMLRKVAGADKSKLLFVTAPDVVADAGATLARFKLWLPVLRYYGLPPALVAQDGQEDLPVPWDELAALFIGGSTAWKMSVHAARLVREAKARGVHVHAGRVNTLRRYRYFDALGADSFDGSAFSKWSDKFVPWIIERTRHHQPGMVSLWEAA
jgi:hypothetical protein